MIRICPKFKECNTDTETCYHFSEHEHLAQCDHVSTSGNCPECVFINDFITAEEMTI